MSQFDEPLKLSTALSELIAVRGYARMEEHRQYRDAWNAVAEANWTQHTRIAKVSRGQMIIEVDNAPLLSELSGFYTKELLNRLQTEFAALKIKSLKFRLRGLA